MSFEYRRGRIHAAFCLRYNEIKRIYCPCRLNEYLMKWNDHFQNSNTSGIVENRCPNAFFYIYNAQRGSITRRRSGCAEPGGVGMYYGTEQYLEEQQFIKKDEFAGATFHGKGQKNTPNPSQKLSLPSIICQKKCLRVFIPVNAQVDFRGQIRPWIKFEGNRDFSKYKHIESL